MSMPWLSPDRGKGGGSSIERTAPAKIRSTIVRSTIGYSDDAGKPQSPSHGSPAGGWSGADDAGGVSPAARPVVVQSLSLEQFKPAPPLSAGVSLTPTEVRQGVLSEEEFVQISGSTYRLLGADRASSSTKLRDFEEVHEVLWFSEVGGAVPKAEDVPRPDGDAVEMQAEIKQLKATVASLLSQLVEECHVKPRVPEGPQDGHVDQVLKLEEDLIAYSKIIRDQQRVIDMQEARLREAQRSKSASPASASPHEPELKPEAPAPPKVSEKVRVIERVTEPKMVHNDAEFSPAQVPPYLTPQESSLPESVTRLRTVGAGAGAGGGESDEEERFVVHELKMGMHGSVGRDVAGRVVEQMRHSLAQKDRIIGEMDRAMASYETQTDKLRSSLRARDLVLGQRQGEISAKDEDLARLRTLLQQKERHNAWLRGELQRRGAHVSKDLDEVSTSSKSSLPDRSTVARRIAMRSSPGQSSPPTLLDISVASPTFSFVSGSVNGDSQKPRASPVVATAVPAGGNLQQFRSDVQGQLSIMSKARSSIYSPRTSAVPFGSKLFKGAGNKAKKHILGPDEDPVSMHSQPDDGSVITL